MIFAVILLVLLFISLFANFAQLVSGISRAFTFNDTLGDGITHNVGPRLEECVVEDHHAANKIAVVRVEGTITDQGIDRAGNSMVDVIRAQLTRAKKDNRVKAVLLKVNSPGGEVLAADEIKKAVARFQDDSGKPVICSMGSMAASGGYYVSAPSRWIVANPLTITGSIGVILPSWNYRGLMDKVGITPVNYKTGKFKDMLSGERSTNEIPVEERAMVQGLIDETYQQFKGVVADGRKQAHKINKTEGKPLAMDWETYADGRVFSGQKALDYGFVDELGDFDKAVERTKKIAGIHNATLVEYRMRYDISDFFRMFGQSESAHTIKLDLGMEFPKLRAGELYFLSSPFEN